MDSNYIPTSVFVLQVLILKLSFPLQLLNEMVNFAFLSFHFSLEIIIYTIFVYSLLSKASRTQEMRTTSAGERRTMITVICVALVLTYSNLMFM